MVPRSFNPNSKLNMVLGYWIADRAMNGILLHTTTKTGDVNHNSGTNIAINGLDIINSLLLHCI